MAIKIPNMFLISNTNIHFPLYGACPTCASIYSINNL